jgi:hypothetical protein
VAEPGKRAGLRFLWVSPYAGSNPAPSIWREKMIIKKKAWPEIFELVKSGKKQFDVRLDDFKCREGDALVLEEWNPQTQKYTGRSLTKKVGYVMKTKNLKFWPKEDVEKYGYQVIQLE